ncbi:phage protein [Ligilactobacillus equi]|uniref:DUF551 domain-containing protein n=1 Tax=Ligilactobacillus equi DSM 15833 = JCM 10991 TaxID=1423740 RepID=A0A0R1TGN2_9LACO|nr:phage protein [Ligilactobacillus equi]KRL78250.1 hypothetical protein FC36_GL001138 [Ligilactobacillus equi DSM 15833 = JCM 10991]
MQWIKVEAQPKEQVSSHNTVFDYLSEMPEDDQEILMSDGHEIWIECYSFYDDETSFDDYLSEGKKIWWMPLPELPIKWV